MIRFPGNLSIYLRMKGKEGNEMAAKRDLYEVLGISKTADEKTIKKAYRKLSKAA